MFRMCSRHRPLLQWCNHLHLYRKSYSGSQFSPRKERANRKFGLSIPVFHGKNDVHIQCFVRVQTYRHRKTSCDRYVFKGQSIGEDASISTLISTTCPPREGEKGTTTYPPIAHATCNGLSAHDELLIYR